MTDNEQDNRMVNTTTNETDTGRMRRIAGEVFDLKIKARDDLLKDQILEELKPYIAAQVTDVRRGMMADVNLKLEQNKSDILSAFGKLEDFMRSMISDVHQRIGNNERSIFQVSESSHDMDKRVDGIVDRQTKSDKKQTEVLSKLEAGVGRLTTLLQGDPEDTMNRGLLSQVRELNDAYTKFQERVTDIETFQNRLQWIFESGWKTTKIISSRAVRYLPKAIMWAVPIGMISAPPVEAFLRLIQSIFGG